MILTNEQIEKAWEWYIKHEDHVLKMIKNRMDNNVYRPSEEDVNHPELWKVGHWLYFIIHIFKL